MVETAGSTGPANIFDSEYEVRAVNSLSLHFV
jgi:hypothetical protein